MKDFALWLANPTSEGATDEEFAETIVLAHKIWKTGDPEADLTKKDMVKANTEEIAANIKEILDEIIFSKEIDPSCWWKK